MKSFRPFYLWSGLFLCCLLSAQSLWANPMVRVRIATNQNEISVEGSGVQILGHENFVQPVAIPKNQQILIHRDLINGKPVWRVERVNNKIQIYTEKYLFLKGADLRLQGKSVPTQIFLSPKKVGNSFKEKTFDVVGMLPLESYLVGVIASEMPLAWPVETLKAQAIAARSYALATMRERAKNEYHLDSTVMDQVFSHIAKQDVHSPLVEKAYEAVASTEGFVLKNGKEKVLKAFYHSDCGGKTVESKKVWGFGDKSGTAVDESCPNNPRAQWSFAIPKKDLSEKLRAFFKRSDLGDLSAFELIRPSKRDRVEKVKVKFSTGQESQVLAHEFRSILGFEHMKSTQFSYQESENQNETTMRFSGQGFGHGVGLCQWGAKSLGKKGKSYEEILNHYYPKATLVK